MFDYKIQQLISLKQEGQYWDFKKEWYPKDKKMNLLHDIICMANNLANQDAYIIIGIDEENDYIVNSVHKDRNRKDTQMIVDFLRDKKFAGGIRPTIYVSPISLEGGYVDVIVIKNSHNTPFYLMERYQSVLANNIYTRVMDTNTPIDKTADIHHVEYLWKKRFRLLNTPLERVQYYLEKSDDWADAPTNWESVKKYYKYAPEFTIEHTLEDDGDAYQYYLFNQTDIRPHWLQIRLYYHQTLLFSTEAISLDGGRYLTPTPFTDGVSLSKYHNWDIIFKYFIKDTLEYTIHRFYFSDDGDEQTTSYNRFMDCILIFNSEEEKDAFKEYIIKNWYQKEKYSKDIWMPHFPQIENYNMDIFKEEYFNVQVLKRMFNAYKNDT